METRFIASLHDYATAHREYAYAHSSHGREGKYGHIETKEVGRAIEYGHLQGMSPVGERINSGDILEPLRLKSENADPSSQEKQVDCNVDGDSNHNLNPL